MHLKQFAIHNNELEALENLPPSISQLAVGGNCLTNDTVRGLNMLVEVRKIGEALRIPRRFVLLVANTAVAVFIASSSQLESVNIAGNDLGSSLPKCFGGMSKLSELCVSDNHLDTLEYNLPPR